jgi:hypothetical protein
MSDDTIDQAPEQSISDRIASKFGLSATVEAEEPASAEAQAIQEDSDLADIEWEGLTFKAPNKVKDALLRQADYTQKTQEVAEQRKQLEHAQSLVKQATLEKSFNESIASEAQEISVIDAYLKQVKATDWSQMSMEQVFRQKMEIDGIKERRDALKESIDSKRSAFQDDLNTKLKELRTRSRELASKKIKDFSETTEKSMIEFGKRHGLSEGEMDNILLDPRSAEIVWKAAQFDTIQANAKPAVEKASKASSTLKPGAASERMPAQTVNKLNYLKAMKGAHTSGEKANLIEQRLAKAFGA